MLYRWQQQAAPAILEAAVARLVPGGRIVVNAVLTQTESTALACLQRLGLRVASSTLAVTRRSCTDGESPCVQPHNPHHRRQMSSEHSSSHPAISSWSASGPGDPELMTYKAVRILSEAKVWAVPTAREKGLSSAQQIAGQMVPDNGRTILSLCFPMKKVYLGQKPTISCWMPGANLRTGMHCASGSRRGCGLSHPGRCHPLLHCFLPAGHDPGAAARRSV